MTAGLCFFVHISMSALFCYWRTEEGQRRQGEGGGSGVCVCRRGRVGLWIPASCLPWQGGPIPMSRPCSLLEQTEALFPSQNTPQWQTWGAAATPVSEWAQCGPVAHGLDLALEKLAHKCWCTSRSGFSSTDVFKSSRASTK